MSHPFRLATIPLVVLAAFGSSCGDGGDEASTETPGALEEGEVIAFTSVGSRMVSDGCSADFTFAWRAIDPDSVPAGAEAVIRVKGPGLTGTYERPIDDSGEVTLRLSTKVDRPNADFTGTLVSIRGPSLTAPPVTHPFLNTACGDGQPTPASSLPPGTPVQGAPCVPGQPLPPGFVCK